VLGEEVVLDDAVVVIALPDDPLITRLQITAAGTESAGREVEVPAAAASAGRGCASVDL